MHVLTKYNRQYGTAPAPVSPALCSVEAVAMASTLWHRGSVRCHCGRMRGDSLAAAGKRPRPPSSHQPPSDMSPKLRASLINDALSRPGRTLTSRLSPLPVCDALFCWSESGLNSEVAFF